MKFISHAQRDGAIQIQHKESAELLKSYGIGTQG